MLLEHWLVDKLWYSEFGYITVFARKARATFSNMQWCLLLWHPSGLDCKNMLNVFSCQVDSCVLKLIGSYVQTDVQLHYAYRTLKCSRQFNTILKHGKLQLTFEERTMAIKDLKNMVHNILTVAWQANVPFTILSECLCFGWSQYLNLWVWTFIQSLPKSYLKQSTLHIQFDDQAGWDMLKYHAMLAGTCEHFNIKPPGT